MNSQERRLRAADETYRALRQIIGEYYDDAMRKDEALQNAMRQVCRLRDELRPRRKR